MEFTLTFNTPLTRIGGGTPQEEGSIFVGKALNPVKEGNKDIIPYSGVIYASQSEKDAGKPEIQIEQLHAEPSTEKGMMMKSRNLEKFITGSIPCEDFNCIPIYSNGSIVLSPESFLSLQDKIKEDLASKSTELTVENIS